MKITWKDDDPGFGYSSATGHDEDGNTYHTPANMETVSVVTPDGRQGFGWTAEEALANACKDQFAKEAV
jgi:hypothetical protein